MVFKEFRRKDRREAGRTAHIALTPTVICYSGAFIRKARLDRSTRVTLHVDDEAHGLALEFHHDLRRPNSFRLSWPPTTDGKRRSCGVTSAFAAVAARHRWVRRVVQSESMEAKRFEPVYDGKLWIVTLGPTFEHEVGRDPDAIPTDATGIYRYLRSATGEVVYIGRGDIRTRLRHPTRAAWDFDLVQYSLLDASEQNRWERHWIERFREEHGRLPEYNRV